MPPNALHHDSASLSLDPVACHRVWVMRSLQVAHDPSLWRYHPRHINVDIPMSVGVPDAVSAAPPGPSGQRVSCVASRTADRRGAAAAGVPPGPVSRPRRASRWTAVCHAGKAPRRSGVQPVRGSTRSAGHATLADAACTAVSPRCVRRRDARGIRSQACQGSKRRARVGCLRAGSRRPCPWGRVRGAACQRGRGRRDGRRRAPRGPCVLVHTRRADALPSRRHPPQLAAAPTRCALVSSRVPLVQQPRHGRETCARTGRQFIRDPRSASNPLTTRLARERSIATGPLPPARGPPPCIYRRASTPWRPAVAGALTARVRAGAICTQQPMAGGARSASQGRPASGFALRGRCRHGEALPCARICTGT